LAFAGRIPRTNPAGGIARRAALRKFTIMIDRASGRDIEVIVLLPEFKLPGTTEP
jgi:hypothetical protein